MKELQSIVDYTRTPDARQPNNVATAINPLFSCTPITDQEGKPDCPYYWTSTSCYHGPNNKAYRSAWYVSFGRAPSVATEGPAAGPGQARSRLVAEAGAIRYDSKAKGGQPAGPGEGGERICNHVRLVRGGAVVVATATTVVGASWRGNDIPRPRAWELHALTARSGACRSNQQSLLPPWSGRGPSGSPHLFGPLPRG